MKKLSTMKSLKDDFFGVLKDIKNMGYKDVLAITENKRMVEYMGGGILLEERAYQGKSYSTYVWDFNKLGV